MAPTVDPNTFHEIGSRELLFGSALTEYETGSTAERGQRQAFDFGSRGEQSNEMKTGT